MRVCAREGCGRSIDHLRADAIYCGQTCRQIVTRVGGSEALQTVKWARTFWTRYGLIRRARRAPQLSTGASVS